MHKDSLGQVLYVGKAVSLRNRVRQYFQSYGKSTPKLRSLTSQIAEFEYITCGSEMEAFILECNLIKKYQPKYNVLLRDDKTYPYIMVTTSERFPRVIKTRELKNDGNKYFGPFSDVGAVNTIVEMLNNTYHLKRCAVTEFKKGHRPCLNYHIGQCPGLCLASINEDDDKKSQTFLEYKKSIEDIISFLSGKGQSVMAGIKQAMEAASRELRFEDAAKYRNLLMAMEELSQAQRVTMVSGKDMDVVLPVKDDENSFVALFQVREGKMIGRETFELSSEQGDTGVDLTSEFLKQYYDKWVDVPCDILVEELPEEVELIQAYLGKNGRKVRISVPKKGENRALLEMAKKDRIELIKTLDARRKSDVDKRDALRKELSLVLEMGGWAVETKGDYRVEAYDISNTNGVDSVGAMVVFQGPRKHRKDYRRFRIKNVTGPDDYASLEEMITRRLARASKGDPAFLELPDIIFMDGGIGQVGSALKAMKNTGFDIPVVGLSKDDSHRTKGMVFPDGTEIDLKERPLLFKFCGTVQEEVHRFAIEYHRGLRGKRAIGSVLDEIPGIGPARRNALLAHFGSVEAIQKADLEELTGVSGMNQKSARQVKEFFDALAQSGV